MPSNYHWNVELGYHITTRTYSKLMMNYTRGSRGYMWHCWGFPIVMPQRHYTFKCAIKGYIKRRKQCVTTKS